MIKDPIKATVYCIIENEDKVLLTEDVGKKGWKLSGGEVENNEFIFKTAKREVKEETGLDIKITGFIGLHEYLNHIKVHRIRIYLSAKITGGKNKLMEGEVKRIKWFTKDELRNLKRSDFYIETYYLAIKDYLKGKIYPAEIINTL